VLSIVSAWFDGEQAGDRDNTFRESERGAHHTQTFRWLMDKGILFRVDERYTSFPTFPV